MNNLTGWYGFVCSPWADYHREQGDIQPEGGHLFLGNNPVWDVLFPAEDWHGESQDPGQLKDRRDHHAGSF